MCVGITASLDYNTAVPWIFLASGRRDVANFIGQWAPTILIMGLYNKLVKVQSSE